MTLNIMYFVLILMIICEIIEYEKSWKHLFIIIVGLLFISLNLTDLIDFSLVYAVPLIAGTMIYGAHRLYVISWRLKDWDNEIPD